MLNIAPRWQAAWWPEMSRGGAMSGSEHGPTLASSVVAQEVAGRGEGPAWWPKRSRGGARAGSEHGSTLASSVGALGADLHTAAVAPSGGRVRTVGVDSELRINGPASPDGPGLHELGVRWFGPKTWRNTFGACW